METVTKKLYEALFLIDSGDAAADWDGVCENIKKMLDRNNADIVSLRKWDERPLAYEIKKRKRGTYILVYFNAPGEAIGIIERDVQLSERIMRVLILKADHLTEEEINKDTPAIAAEKAIAENKIAAEKAAAEAVIAEENIEADEDDDFDEEDETEAEQH